MEQYSFVRQRTAITATDDYCELMSTNILPAPKLTFRKDRENFFVNFCASTKGEYKHLFSRSNIEFLKETVHCAVQFEDRLKVTVTCANSSRIVTQRSSDQGWSDEKLFLHCVVHNKTHLLLHVPLESSSWNSVIPVVDSYATVSLAEFMNSTE